MNDNQMDGTSMKPSESIMEAFFHGMQFYVDVSREARQALASAVAESFSFFDYLQTDENLLSRIIADLLNPKGNHGQGSTFLVCFLQRLIDGECKCVLPTDWLTRVDKALVINEAATSFLLNTMRRIDIRIELPPDFGIGIENKPWAVEQNSQLTDYCTELNRRYMGQFVLVFLCQQGRKPESILEGDWFKLQHSGKGVSLGYTNEFLQWLLDCHQKCKADKVRHFIYDFTKYVRFNLGGINKEEEQYDVR